MKKVTLAVLVMVVLSLSGCGREEQRNYFYTDIETGDEMETMIRTYEEYEDINTCKIDWDKVSITYWEDANVATWDNN